MSADLSKTWGAGEVQVFNVSLEPPAEQERLNRLLKRKLPDPMAVARILDLARGVEPWQVEKSAYGCSLVVDSVPGRPAVRVHLMFLGRDETGTHLVDLIGLCGPADATNVEKVQRHSDRFAVETISRRTLEETEHFVVREVARLDQLTSAELQRLVGDLVRKVAQMRDDLDLRG